SLLYPSFSVNLPAPPDTYTLSLHDALPIWRRPTSLPGPPSWSWAKSTACPWRWCVVWRGRSARELPANWCAPPRMTCFVNGHSRSEEHTSELQSPCNLVCRLLLEKKKK